MIPDAVAEMDSLHKRLYDENVETFLSIFPSVITKIRLRKMLIYSFFYKVREAGLVSNKEQPYLDYETFYREQIHPYFALFREVLNPRIFEYAGFHKKIVAKRVFRNETIGAEGFFRVPEHEIKKYLFRDYEIALCFSELARHLEKRKNESS